MRQEPRAWAGVQREEAERERRAPMKSLPPERAAAEALIVVERALLEGKQALGEQEAAQLRQLRVALILAQRNAPRVGAAPLGLGPLLLLRADDRERCVRHVDVRLPQRLRDLSPEPSQLCESGTR